MALKTKRASENGGALNLSRVPKTPKHELARVCTGIALAMSCSLASAATPAPAELDAVLQRLADQAAALEAQQQELNRQRRELETLRQQLEQQYSLEPSLRSQVVVASESGVEQNAGAAPELRGVNRPEQIVAAEHEEGLEWSGYGVVNYYNRDWDTDKFAKDGFDTERFILEMEYRYNSNWWVKAELEYEHGGTGVTLELDGQEEFGEFEQEIEAGGEILVEELFVGYNHAQWLNAKFGHFVVPVGRTNKYHKPQDYFTVARSDADAALVPLLWHESGIALYGSWSLGDWGTIKYEGQLVNGLDSTGFSSRNWVAGGHQTRFNEARAEELALVGRVDYLLGDALQIGASYYGGDTTGNRPKNDMDIEAYVDIWQIDGAWTPGDFTFRYQYMWGRLQNSHLVTEANRKLSNNLGVKRTPVGSEAQSWFVEAGYDLMPLFSQGQQALVLFGRYDNYDSMYATEGLVYNNPRWHRESFTVGVNYLPIPNVIFKAEYNQRELVDLDANNNEDTIAVGVGFTY